MKSFSKNFKSKFRLDNSFRLLMKKGAGFTVFDMLMAVALIAVFSTLVAANYSDFRQTSNLNAETEKLSSLIRKAQLWALSGQTRGGVRPAGGWGVYVEQCTTPPCGFFLYADVFPVSPPNHAYDAGSDEIVSEIFTGQRVQISNVTPISGTAVDLVFTSPTSTGYINGSKLDSQAQITFYHQDSYRSQSLTIDRLTNRILMAEATAPPTNPACSDGIDNDLDSYIDWPNDPGCINSVDNDEFNSVIIPPPTPIIIFEDTFTESDLELTNIAYSVETGTGWQQLFSVVNNNEISGAALRAGAASGALEQLSCGANSGAFYQTVDIFTNPNYRVQARFENTGGADDFGMIAARIQPNGDMYLFQWDTAHGQLFMRYNGAWLQLGRDTAGVNLGDTVSMTVWSNRIGVWKDNGTTLIINELNSTISAAGRAGVGLGSVVTYNADCNPQRLDDFQVWENVSAPSAQCNDSLDNDNDGWPDLSDAECTDGSDDLEYATLPQIIPEYYDDFNAENADTYLDDGAYLANVNPPFGNGWVELISNPAGQTLIASDSNDRLEDGGGCGGSDGILYRTVDTFSSPDYEVSVYQINGDTADDFNILAARIQDSNNMYALKWNESNNNAGSTEGIWKRSGGIWSNYYDIGTPSIPVPDGSTVTLKVQGAEVSMLVNGITRASWTDPSPINVAGYAGVGMGAVIDVEPTNDCSGQLLDNFKVLVP